MIVAIRRAKWWLAANGLGALAFLYFASRTWLEPELRGEVVARGGDAVVWSLTALPILLLFAMANLVWLGLALYRLAKVKDGKPALVVCATACLWLGVALFDQLYH